MSADQQQIARVRFHRALARAHDEYADALTGLGAELEEPDTPQLRGSFQRRIVGLPEMIGERGMTSKEVAAATRGDEPNSHTTLKTLVEKGVVEMVEGASPQRFRLAAKHRRDRVLRLSRLIGEGEWTTYKDFSIAIYDSSKMGLAVARVAHHHPAFAHPHRVVQAGGTISPKWRDEDEDSGPEECIRRLTAEGAWDVTEGRAKAERLVGWEELRRRLSREYAEDDLDAA